MPQRERHFHHARRAGRTFRVADLRFYRAERAPLAAARIGGPLGLLPWESMLKMGTGFGWLLVQLGTTAADLAWFGAALLVAALASR